MDDPASPASSASASKYQAIMICPSGMSLISDTLRQDATASVRPCLELGYPVCNETKRHHRHTAGCKFRFRGLGRI